MSGIDGILNGLAENQIKRTDAFLIVALMFTLIMLIGIPNLSMESDFNKELPQELPSLKLQNKVSDEFGGDVILLLIQIDPESQGSNDVVDIRDPRVIQMLIDLEAEMKERPAIVEVTSAGTFFKQTGVPPNLNAVKSVQKSFPELGKFFNDNYDLTILYASANIGKDNKKINRLIESIEEDIRSVSIPPGIKIRVTGTPSVEATIMELLQEDLVFTGSLSASVILALLLLFYRFRGFLIFTPVVLGVIWTMGTMAWLDIPLSVATVGVTAMLIGLGVEYGVFYVVRFYERKDNGMNNEESLREAVPGVGSAIFGSGTTTIMGFLALTISFMPMLQKLGFILALGIFYSLLAALLVNPPLVLARERVLKKEYFGNK